MGGSEQMENKNWVSAEQELDRDNPKPVIRLLFDGTLPPREAGLALSLAFFVERKREFIAKILRRNGKGGVVILDEPHTKLITAVFSKKASEQDTEDLALYMEQLSYWRKPESKQDEELEQVKGMARAYHSLVKGALKSDKDCIDPSGDAIEAVRQYIRDKYPELVKEKSSERGNQKNYPSFSTIKDWIDRP